MDQRQRPLSAAAFLGIVVFATAAGDFARAAETSAGLGIGTIGGTGLQAEVVLADFTRDAPLSLRAAVAHAGRDAGVPMDARHVFINENTNGTPEESGKLWSLRLDLLLPVARLGAAPVTLGLGLRKAYFTGTFAFVDGNETFDVTGSPWGVGLSLDTALAMSRRTAFTLRVGVDRYFDAALAGHGSTYAPDDQNVNAHEDYTWADADAAVNQPRWEVVALAGVRWRFGD
jgi:hypothetical protein